VIETVFHFQSSLSHYIPAVFYVNLPAALHL